MRRTQREYDRMEWLQVREDSLAVECPEPPWGCSQPVGEVCVNTDGKPLGRSPAHAIRIRRASEVAGVVSQAKEQQP